MFTVSAALKQAQKPSRRVRQCELDALACLRPLRLQKKRFSVAVAVKAAKRRVQGAELDAPPPRIRKNTLFSVCRAGKPPERQVQGAELDALAC